MSAAHVFILITVVAVAAAFVMLSIFGLRNLGRGKHNPFSVAAVVIPFVVFAICVAITGLDFAKAAILTVIIMAIFAILGLLYSGLRGLTG